VGNFDWSPDGSAIAFDHRLSSDPADGGSADISGRERRERRAQAARHAERTRQQPAVVARRHAHRVRHRDESIRSTTFQNDVIAVMPAGGGPIASLTDAFDENPSLVAWTPRGIFFAASQRTWAYLFQLDPQSKQITQHARKTRGPARGFSLTRDGQSRRVSSPRRDGLS
jgi:hypothetical protein